MRGKKILVKHQLVVTINNEILQLHEAVEYSEYAYVVKKTDEKVILE